MKVCSVLGTRECSCEKQISHEIQLSLEVVSTFYSPERDMNGTGW